MNASVVLFDFKESESVTAWASIDDRVMGGLSRSEMVFEYGQAHFRGVVSDQNNGGFASIRASLQENLMPSADHLWVESRGDGNNYYLSVRTNNGFDGVSYRASFQPTVKTTRIDIPLSEFKPVFRGRAVPDAPVLEPQSIEQIGLMISDRQLGQFDLLLQAIGYHHPI